MSNPCVTATLRGHITSDLLPVNSRKQHGGQLRCYAGCCLHLSRSTPAELMFERRNVENCLCTSAHRLRQPWVSCFHHRRSEPDLIDIHDRCRVVGASDEYWLYLFPLKTKARCWWVLVGFERVRRKYNLSNDMWVQQRDRLCATDSDQLLISRVWSPVSLFNCFTDTFNIRKIEVPSWHLPETEKWTGAERFQAVFKVFRRQQGAAEFPLTDWCMHCHLLNSPTLETYGSIIVPLAEPGKKKNEGGAKWRENKNPKDDNWRWERSREGGEGGESKRNDELKSIQRGEKWLFHLVSFQEDAINWRE